MACLLVDVQAEANSRMVARAVKVVMLFIHVLHVEMRLLCHEIVVVSIHRGSVHRRLKTRAVIVKTIILDPSSRKIVWLDNHWLPFE